LSIKVGIENFGPFERAELELKPLTVIIGRNSIGKSMLIYLLWALLTSRPDPEKLANTIRSEHAAGLAMKILQDVGSGRNPEEEFRKLVEMHLEALLQAIASGLRETLQRVFMADLRELIRSGARRALISVSSPDVGLEILVEGDNVEMKYTRPYSEFVRRLRVEVPEPKRFRVLHGSDVLNDRVILSLADVAYTLFVVLGYYLAPFFVSEATLFPDSRAGIGRTLLRPYLLPAVVKGISYVDEMYVSTFYRLAEAVSRGLVNIDMLRPLLDELGCVPEVVFEGGVYTVYLNMWSGRRLKFPQAPSGIREVLAVALALASRGEPDIVMIEEPEAHLHPRAQRVLARLVARAVNELEKTVVITTHSDYILYALNDLIALSGRVDRARELGFLESEALKPDDVSVYLVRAEAGKAVLERLEVGPEGVSEEEFTRVARELAEERAKILG